MFNITEHLYERGLKSSVCRYVVDEYNAIVTFFLWNISGQMVGYQRYNPFGTKRVRNHEKNVDILKYYTYVGTEGAVKKLGVWGLESLNAADDIVFIVEGIFDAIKIHNMGYPALAVISNDPHHLQGFFCCLPMKKIAICDNDKAGMKLAKYADACISVPAKYHDLGDMTDLEVASWLPNSLFQAGL